MYRYMYSAWCTHPPAGVPYTLLWTLSNSMPKRAYRFGALTGPTLCICARRNPKMALLGCACLGAHYFGPSSHLLHSRACPRMRPLPRVCTRYSACRALMCSSTTTRPRCSPQRVCTNLWISMVGWASQPPPVYYSVHTD
jgi:hypothetical protein